MKKLLGFVGVGLREIFWIVVAIAVVFGGASEEGVAKILDVGADGDVIEEVLTITEGCVL